MTKLIMPLIVLAVSITGCNPEETISKEALGEKLFKDKTLSKNKTMSCATCHNPEHAFIDTRNTSMTLGASLGDDGQSIGDRNAPMITYACFSPKFYFDTNEGIFKGGQFLDGRASDLIEQAKGPFLNPIEMNMPDAQTVVQRVKENSVYLAYFKELYGENIFDTTQKAYEAIAQSIEAFEQSDLFFPFDSKYDRYLKGEYTLTNSEARGLALFTDESPGGAMCSACHTVNTHNGHPLFTDFSYDNLGVPVNIALRNANAVSTSDVGLYGNSAVSDTSLQGAFKVPSLRNIAVTAPYMHNGYFKTLKAVVHFYNTRDLAGAINPETNQTWEQGAFHTLRNIDELGNLGLSNQDEEDIVAFLKILTDRRYEYLIP